MPSPLRIFGSALLLALALGTGWLAVYAYDSGFTNKWRKLIRKEFARHQLDVELGKLTLDPREGLVARHVILYQDDSRERILATINKARLEIDVAGLVKKELFLESIDLRYADLTLPLEDNPQGKALTLKSLNAKIFLPPERIEIAGAEAEWSGLRLQLNGTLFRPEKGQKLFSPEGFDWHQSRESIIAIQDALEGLKSRFKNPPVIEATVSGDLADFSTLKASLMAKAPRMEWGDYGCRNLEIDADISASSIDFQRLSVSDDRGRLHGRGQFPFSERELTLDIHSTLNHPEVLRLVLPENPALDRLTFHEASEVKIQGTVAIDQPFTWENPPVDLTGSVQTGAFTSSGARFENGAFDFRVSGPRFFVQNAIINEGSGTARGRALLTPAQGFRYDAHLDFDPGMLGALIPSEALDRFLKKWSFTSASGVDITVIGEGPDLNPADWKTEGEATLTRCHFQNEPIKSVSVGFTLAGGG
ncbi:MAG: hypothetical protein AAF514_09425 [Verrucomicrobiota bacterium]